MRNIILGMIIFLFTTIVYANADETGKITRIIVEGNNIVSVWLDGADVNAECNGAGRWTIVSGNDQLFKEKVSTLLAAAASQQTVHLHHETSWGCGPWNSNTIHYVDVKY